MTFRLDKDALKYNDMKYIVDSGASTFNSKGFTLYTVQGNLRADLAVANKEFCAQIPLIVQRWQDVLVTWKKGEGKYRSNGMIIICSSVFLKVVRIVTGLCLLVNVSEKGRIMVTLRAESPSIFLDKFV